MPTVAVNRDLLFQHLGKIYTEEDFDELCFQFGIELDEVTSEREQITKEQGETRAQGCSDDVIYKLDIPANRHDLLCMEGIIHNLKVFLKQQEAPKFQVAMPTDPLKMYVTKATRKIRPFVLCSVLRDVKMTKEVYDNLIELQEKLHQNLGRKRTLVSIGVHDLDTIQGPFTYDTKLPSEIRFCALNRNDEKDANELMKIFEDTHLKPYLPIISEAERFPVITDSNGIVLSMPPIINGNHSKITMTTSNIFIEITATDPTKASIALDTISALFSVHCATPYVIEGVHVIDVVGDVIATPKMNYRCESVKVDYLNRKIGTDVSAARVADILTRMCLKSRVVDEASGEIEVEVPPTRSDILHHCDIVEDVAIALGYDAIERTLPRSATIGAQQLSMKISERLRHHVAATGFTEALTFALCSAEDCSSKMRIIEDQLSAVRLANPKTLDFQVVRTSLLPGLLKTAASNKNLPLPLKLFEIQEVVLRDLDAETGARNERRFAAINYNQTSGFEIIHGLVDHVMKLLEVKWRSTDHVTVDDDNYYYITKADNPAYLPGRCANIVMNEHVIGQLGVLHPAVLGNFELNYPVSAVEFNLEGFY